MDLCVDWMIVFELILDSRLGQEGGQVVLDSDALSERDEAQNVEAEV
jgi:hypothetical protein